MKIDPQCLQQNCSPLKCTCQWPMTSTSRSAFLMITDYILSHNIGLCMVLRSRQHSLGYNGTLDCQTRSQTVAKIAERTVSQQTITISDCCKIASPSVFEILDTKRIGVMTLTFQDHVTTTVTWPFDIPHVISGIRSFPGWLLSRMVFSPKDVSRKVVSRIVIFPDRTFPGKTIPG